jgi:hypothetical protein
MRRRKANVLNDPELVELLGRDPELLAIADAIAETHGVERSSRRRTTILAAAAAAAIVLITLPALAAFTPLIDFSSAPAAGGPAVRSFEELEREAPPGMDPRVIAQEARRLDLPLPGSGTVAVYVAPTRTGGFCFQIPGATLGCYADRSVATGIGFAATRLDGGPAIVYGWLQDPDAFSAGVTTADGTRQKAPLVRIGPPISVSVFVVPIANVAGALPIAVVVKSSDGKRIHAQTIDRPPA